MFANKKIHLILGLIASLASISAARAFKPATVNSDSADVKQSADENSSTLSTLPKGTRVNTSDRTTHGYYRATSAHSSGWILARDLNFGESPPLSSSPEKPARNWSVQAFGGFDLWTPADVNNLVQSNSLDTGVGYGAEIGYRLSRKWTWLLRVERLSKSVNGTAQPNNTPIAMSLSSTPVLTGAQYHLATVKSWSFDTAFLIGLALGTTLTVDENSAGNPTRYSASPLTALIKFDVGYQFLESFSFFFEPGYRFLSTSQLVPSTIGSATGFLQGSNGTYTPIALSLSGVVTNFGLRFSF